MLFSSAYDMLNKSVHMGNFDPQKWPFIKQVRVTM